MELIDIRIDPEFESKMYCFIKFEVCVHRLL